MLASLLSCLTERDMKTRLILREEVPSLGNIGDEVEVASGYARNHLIPMGLALPWSDSSIERVANAKKEADEQRESLAKEHAALAEKINNLQLNFEEKVSEEGHLYGSVNEKRIAAALAEKGVDVGENQVRLGEPIRKPGEYEVAVHIHAELQAVLKVWVVGDVVETPEEVKAELAEMEASDAADRHPLADVPQGDAESSPAEATPDEEASAEASPVEAASEGESEESEQA